MEKPESVDSKPGIQLIFSILMGVLLAGIIVSCIVYWKEITAVVSSREALETWLTGLGPWAGIAFIAFQFLQVVVFVIPGEIPQLAGGYFFGVWLGLGYSVVGIALGSAFAFMAARWLGVSFVKRIFGAKQVEKFETFISSPRALVAFFLLFLIPGLPKDILCYIGGLSFLRVGVFIVLSMVARLPGLLGSVLIGNAASNHDWSIVIIIGLVGVVFFSLGILFRKRLHDWIVKLVYVPESSKDEK